MNLKYLTLFLSFPDMMGDSWGGVFAESFRKYYGCKLGYSQNLLVVWVSLSLCIHRLLS